VYYRYFGLREEPFSIAVNPRYLFMSDRHRDALAHLLYGVGAGGGFILLTGEVGTGKTTINRCLLEQLPAETDTALILNPALDAEELLAAVCDEFGIEYDARSATLKELTDKLHAFLLENHRRGRNTVLLIDEAQHLRFEVLEQIRLLTNLETDTRKLLRIVLVGQPELNAMLDRPELRQLNQRITARYDLQALDPGETGAYIRHRLQVAGLPANQELFPPAVVKGIYRRSGGIPRLINLLCDRMLLGTYGQNKSRVDKKMLRRASVEVLGRDRAATSRDIPVLGLGVAAAIMLAVGAFWWREAGEVPAPRAQGVAREETVSAPTASPVPDGPPWYRNRDRALEALAGHMGIDAGAGNCAAVEAFGWRCESLAADSWDELLKIDRPAVLSLLTAARFSAAAVLVGRSGEQAVLLRDGRRLTFPLARLGPMWRGDYTILWRPPEAYTAPFGRGARAPVVAWLAREFAALDGQGQPLAGEEFNVALDSRVRMFQRQHELRDDGVVGLRTLLKLNAVRGHAGATLGDAAPAAPGVR